MRAKLRSVSSLGLHMAEYKSLVSGKSPEKAMETPGSLFFPVQEDIVQKLLSDMDLSPEGGPSNLTMTSENPPQLLLSRESDIPALCPNWGLSENPLKQLLANEEGECQLRARRGQDPS